LKQKDSADKNATSILVLQGHVMNMGKGQTLINCATSGRFNVKWRNNTMPNIKQGDYITLVGKLITLDLGRAFVVVGAELLPAFTLKEIKHFIQEKKGTTNETSHG
jgi:hypothetical protein